MGSRGVNQELEEGGRGAVAREDLEDARRIFGGSVIDGEGQRLAAARSPVDRRGEHPRRPPSHGPRRCASVRGSMASRFPIEAWWRGLTCGQMCPRLREVKGAEFERKVRKLARKRNVACQFVAALGKGSHGRLYFGKEFTTLKDRKKEIGRDLLAKMCADLGIDPHDL